MASTAARRPLASPPCTFWVDPPPGAADPADPVEPRNLLHPGPPPPALAPPALDDDDISLPPPEVVRPSRRDRASGALQRLDRACRGRASWSLAWERVAGHTVYTVDIRVGGRTLHWVGSDLGAVVELALRSEWEHLPPR